jgi:hypothetical protein
MTNWALNVRTISMNVGSCSFDVACSSTMTMHISDFHSETNIRRVFLHIIPGVIKKPQA